MGLDLCTIFKYGANGSRGSQRAKGDAYNKTINQINP